MVIKGKKGSHVGLVLSFVIFVTFLFFVFTILNPAVSEERGKELALELIKENLINNLTSNLSVTSLKVHKITDYGLKKCFQIDNVFGENVKIKNGSNDYVEGSSSGINDLISINHNGEYFFRIFYSPVFLAGGGGGREECEPLVTENYTLGSTKVTSYIYEDHVNSLFTFYENNYLVLKEDLGISVDNDFGVSFVKSSGDENQIGFEEVSGNVYIEEILLQYYNSEADVQSGSIKIRVW